MFTSARVSKAVFISSLPPFLLKTSANPEGVHRSVFDGILASIAKDRFAYLSAFLSDFYNYDVLGGKLVSQDDFRYSWNVGANASPKGNSDCVLAWLTDFREDLKRIDVPALIIHGVADRILPINATGVRLHEALNGSKFLPIDGGPHAIIWTHADIVNAELLDFLGQSAQAMAA